MSKYILRLDDASDKRNITKWDKIENLADKYNIKPLIGIIPYNEDKSFAGFDIDDNFWSRVRNWQKKKYTIALHGYNHVYSTNSGGINPVNFRSEFAGLPLNEQRNKIRQAIDILKKEKVKVEIFFAPSHTFDLNTLEALKLESDIRIISDTIANAPYSMHGFTFVPQQSGEVRKLPFNVVTFCYHPNEMTDEDFEKLEKFLIKNKNKFIEFPKTVSKRKKSLLDRFLSYLYFRRRK